jgi:N-acetylmuramic acid 6-phosphate etherase
MNEGLPETEARSDRSRGLDGLETHALARLLLEEQSAAAHATRAAAGAIAQAIDRIAECLRSGGRLHYVGAGTSGRIGVLDAAEMPPTFGTPPPLVCAHIAGGDAALRGAVEGAEDDGDAGEAEMRDHVRAGDAVVGLSAGGGAAFVTRAVTCASGIGARTFAITSAPSSALANAAEFAIVLATGSEPLTGSTRLKAGTAQKIALNTISTGVMVRLGKVYDNLMVDVVATNAKLRNRAVRLVRELAGVRDDEAEALLSAAEGSVKTAVVMSRCKLEAAAARAALEREHGFLRRLI